MQRAWRRPGARTPPRLGGGQCQLRQCTADQFSQRRSRSRQGAGARRVHGRPQAQRQPEAAARGRHGFWRPAQGRRRRFVLLCRPRGADQGPQLPDARGRRHQTRRRGALQSGGRTAGAGQDGDRAQPHQRGHSGRLPRQPFCPQLALQQRWFVSSRRAHRLAGGFCHRAGQRGQRWQRLQRPVHPAPVGQHGTPGPADRRDLQARQTGGAPGLQRRPSTLGKHLAGGRLLVFQCRAIREDRRHLAAATGH